MNWIEALILGAVQGLTEFLPVSSSGHLQLAKQLLGVDPAVGGLTFDLTLHAATVVSTVVVLWSEVRRLFLGVFSRRFNAEQQYVLKILLSMIPVMAVGFLLEKPLDALLGSSFILLVVGGCLLLTAVLLFLANRVRERSEKPIGWRDAFIIGLAQAVAVLPGLSRSGTTIATGLMLGNNRSEVARFSFLMVLIPVAGKMVLDLMDGQLTAQAVDTGPLLTGFIGAFAVGCLACKFMLSLVRRGRLTGFAIYCAVVGALSLVAYGVS